MATLKIRKEKKTSTAVKPLGAYLETHEKLTAISNESGIPIVKLLAMFVDFSVEHLVLVEPEEKTDE